MCIDVAVCDTFEDTVLSVITLKLVFALSGQEELFPPGLADVASELELEKFLLGHKCCTLLCCCQDTPHGCCWCLGLPRCHPVNISCGILSRFFSFTLCFLTIKFRLKFSKAASTEMCVKFETQIDCPSLVRAKFGIHHVTSGNPCVTSNNLFQIIKEYERAIIFRLGRILKGGAKGPGMSWRAICSQLVISKTIML